MSIALELPRCVQVIAYEEAQLILQLRSLLPRDAAISSDIAMLTRNELLHEAQRLLPSDAWADFVCFADWLTRQLQDECITSFPSPLYLAATTKAEALAEAFLREGAGCLWSAVREVVRALEYEADPRDIATGLVFRLGLYSKGGITGITRQSWRHVAASRLLNALVALTLDTHRWNAISVNMDNATAVHVDGRNAAEKSLLIGLSHHRGGGLWIQDNAGTELKEAGGVCYRGVVYPTSARAVQFDGRTRLHGNMPWADHRCVLIAFTVNVNGHSALDRAHAEHLVDAGYRLPERTFNSAFGSAAPGQLQLDKFFR